MGIEGDPTVSCGEMEKNIWKSQSRILILVFMLFLEVCLDFLTTSFLISSKPFTFQSIFFLFLESNPIFIELKSFPVEVEGCLSICRLFCFSPKVFC